jgi:hypothetical protein
MRVPRLTLRGMIFGVMGFGIALHLVVATVRVAAVKEYHSHTWVEVLRGKPYMVASSQQPRFWPRYWRCILGLSWRRVPGCSPVGGRLLDVCEFDHPEIVGLGDGRGGPVGFNKAQRDLWKSLEGK